MDIKGQTSGNTGTVMHDAEIVRTTALAIWEGIDILAVEAHAAPMQTSGADLRAKRQAAGLTQQAVADALGITRATVINWEQRAVVRPAAASEYLRVVSELASRGSHQE